MYCQRISYFGGMPENVLTDNMKTVGDGARGRKAHLEYAVRQNFAAELGFVPKVCRIRSPQTRVRWTPGAVCER